MTEHEQPVKGPWEALTPVFGARLRAPKKPPRPSDGAIAAAQQSYTGRMNPETNEMEHVMTHRFGSVEEAAKAVDELKRAGAFTKPETTVTAITDPDETGDKRIVRWRTGEKRGRR